MARTLYEEGALERVCYALSELSVRVHFVSTKKKITRKLVGKKVCTKSTVLDKYGTCSVAGDSHLPLIG